MTKIYHNPRCAKSRQTLELLESLKEEVTIVRYLEEVPSKEELKSLLKMLGLKPIQLVRKGEPVWKEKFKGKELSDTQLISAMVTYPKLIERPIVVKEGKAVIGRPPEKVKILL